QVLAVGLDDHATAVDRADAPSSRYLVRAGDTLWSIAMQTYGSGTEYRRLVTANVGRRMPDGGRFTAQGIIRPGWILAVPAAPTSATPNVEHADWYTVQPGDTLSSIAGSTLGDRERWSELFELN